ncbi:MAG: neutral/alkaline non-lysosomal ceramidase N-terminal domain-containing protein [Caldilineaceae bacterium]
MLAGFAEVTITPRNADCLIAGYALRPATGVHDDLVASAVYLDDGVQKALLVSYDLLAMERELIARIKSAICQSLPLSEGAIFLTCTHTHEGPEVRERKFRDKWYGEERPAYLDPYLEFLCERTVRAARDAMDAAQPCDLLVNQTQVDENVNRRLFLSDERYVSFPGNKQLLPAATGYADKELGILAFCAAGTRQPFGMIVNYTVHPLTAGALSPVLSADIPGVVRRTVKESLGCPVCYVTGACGDNHPKAPESGFAETERAGRILATQAIARTYDGHRIPDAQMRLRAYTGAVTVKQRTWEEFKQLPLFEHDEGTLRQNICRVEQPGGEVDAAFSLLAIGPVLLVGIPGELLAELGATLKWFSPFKRTYIMYQATDSFDYIPHPNAFLWGGFETWCGQLSPTAIRPLINAILDAAEQLSRQ